MQQVFCLQNVFGKWLKNLTSLTIRDLSVASIEFDELLLVLKQACFSIFDSLNKSGKFIERDCDSSSLFFKIKNPDSLGCSHKKSFPLI